MHRPARSRHSTEGQEEKGPRPATDRRMTSLGKDRPPKEIIRNPNEVSRACRKRTPSLRAPIHQTVKPHTHTHTTIQKRRGATDGGRAGGRTQPSFSLGCNRWGSPLVAECSRASQCSPSDSASPALERPTGDGLTASGAPHNLRTHLGVGGSPNFARRGWRPPRVPPQSRGNTPQHM